MAIHYKVIEKAQPGVVGGGTRKHSATLVKTETINEAKFRKMLSEKSRQSEGEIMYMLYVFKELLMEQLQQGNIVKTGILGTFYPILSSRGKTLPGEVKAKDIQPGINYRPSKEMKEMMEQTPLKKISGK